MIQHMTETLEREYQIHWRSREFVWTLAGIFAEDREAFCRWMLDGSVRRNGVTYY